MIVDVEGRTARLTLEEYPDLLAVRALPEWRFVDDRIVECDRQHLDVIGVADPAPTTEWGPYAGYLFDYQTWIVDRALTIERFAVFADCGLGKTPMQLEWVEQIRRHQPDARALIVAPLNVVAQTIDEHARFYPQSPPIVDCRDRSTLTEWLDSDRPGVAITNYEKIDGTTEPLTVDAVVLDESSVLKQSMGARRTSLMRAFSGVRFKLCCTATPAPNDRVEYAEHAYFLEQVRSTREFLAAYFVNRDGSWQLKGHGREAFWRDLAAWSVFMRHPAAFRFADNLASLPPIRHEYPTVPLSDEQATRARGHERGTQPSLFGVTPGGVTSRTKLMQIANGFTYHGKDPTDTFESAKPAEVARLACDMHGTEQIIVWVNFDVEGDQLAAAIPDSMHLSGKTSKPKRNDVIDQFRRGTGPRVLIVKPSMFGFGLNLQTCRVQIFSTITDSYERFYQAVRRSYRYGQHRPVIIYVPLTPVDEAICQNVLNKQSQWEEDGAQQERAFARVLRPADQTTRRTFVTQPQPELDRDHSDRWTLIHGDSIVHMDHMPDESMDLAVFSPPFANLFTYSSAAADMGNVRSDSEYRLQWAWFAERLLRVMKPGRNVAVHCADVIRFAGQHGIRHTYDYPSDLRAGMEDAGFTYRSRIAIDKNPQVQATRTKDQNLLFITLKRDALKSHAQACEYLLIFTAPGENAVPVIADDITNQEWIEWAHHIWYDIRETDVLNAALGKDADDERHICPLQLGLIERVVRLWTNPGELVYSPFAGIGSEGVEAIRHGRRFYGVELKRSYYDTARRFLRETEAAVDSELSLFNEAEVAP